MIAWAAPVAALAAVLAGLVAFQRLPPYAALGALLLAVAAALAVFRVFAVAIPLALLGFGFLRQSASHRAKPSPGKTSEVRTATLYMRLDHDTGEMDGEVLDGPFAGASLSQMDPNELQDLLAWLEAESDENSVSLLLAFLDRHGFSATQSEPADLSATGEMSEAEAYRILGLKPGASIDEVREAHRRLIRRVHPDLGGSTALASMINSAKEKLDPN